MAAKSIDSIKKIIKQCGADDRLLRIAVLAMIFTTMAEHISFVKFSEVLPVLIAGLILGVAGQTIPRLRQMSKSVSWTLRIVFLLIIGFFISLFVFSSTSAVYVALLIAVAGALMSIIIPRRFFGYVFLFFVVLLAAFQVTRLVEFAVLKAVVFYGLTAIWLVLWFKRRESPKPFLFTIMVFFLTAVTIPAQEGRYYPPTRSQVRAVGRQPNVEVLFTNKNGGLFPRYRKEMFCDPVSGAKVVTPHAPDDFATLIYPDGRKKRVFLGGETPGLTYNNEGVWYASNNADFLEVDLKTGEILSRVPCCTPHIMHVRYDPDADLLALSRSTNTDPCLLTSLRGPNARVFRSLNIPGYEFIPFENGKLLVSGEHGVRWVDPQTGRDEKVNVFRRRGVYFDVVPDKLRGTAYAPDNLAGIIYVLNLETLEIIRSFPTMRGVRGVLLDAENESRLFSWNYATGEVIEHTLPGGEKVSSWILGPLLRNLAWDCDNRSLLAVTSLGGFRIRPL